MFVNHAPWTYKGSLSDYQKVSFVLPTNTTNALSGLGDLSSITGTQWLGIAALGAAVYWFGFRKK
jgi:hypothetical protein